MSALKSPLVLLAVVAAFVVGGLAAWAVVELAGDDEDDDAVEQVLTVGPTSPEPAAPAGDGGDAPEQPAPPPSELDVDDDQPLSPEELRRAAGAALELVGGDTVTEVQRSDDLGEAYEVEVLTAQGEVDVALDERFERVPNLRYDD